MGSTQPLTEMSTRNLPDASRRVRLTSPPSVRADYLEKTWEPRRLTTIWASTACHRDSFTSYFMISTARGTRSVCDVCRNSLAL
jgi:hypothetical protein